MDAGKSVEQGLTPTEFKELVKRLGFRVENTPEKPPQAVWGYEIVSPPPLAVRLRAFMLNTNVLVLGIGVKFSPEHQQSIQALEPKEKLRLSSKLILEILRVCPYCRVAVQPTLDNPEAVIAEIHRPPTSYNKAVIAEDLVRLVNVYIAINAVLWNHFPQVSNISKPQPYM